MIQFIKKLIWQWQYKKAVREAVNLRQLTGRKQFVVNFNGKPKVISKKAIRQLVATHTFRKGVTTADIEQKALFVTK
jgi:hypothetical protein